MVWPTPLLALAAARLYADCKSAGPYPLGVTVGCGAPDGSTRTNEWQRASPGAELGQTLACRKRIAWPVLLTLAVLLGPVMTEGTLSAEHAANAARAVMLRNERARNDTGYSPKRMVTQELVGRVPEAATSQRSAATPTLSRCTRSRNHGASKHAH